MRNIVLSITIFFMLPLSALSFAQYSSWVPYGPKVVSLHGKMLRVVKYGPPNYGKNPESDAKYDIPIILLNAPIMVDEDPVDPRNKVALMNVSFVQLILHSMPSEYWRYANQDIVVTGTLFRAETGHHYTDVVMDVETIRAVGN
jgi:hypothetical protein